MRITKKWLEKKEACSPAVDMWESTPESDPVKVVEKLIELKKYDWCNWFLTKYMGRKDCIRYAIFSAEQVLPFFEKKYPDDKRPMEAIEAAKAVLKMDTKANREKAGKAFTSASASASSASASSAAYSSASACEYALTSAYAASACEYCVFASAYTCEASAEKEMRLKILNYGLKLIKKRGGR